MIGQTPPPTIWHRQGVGWGGFQSDSTIWRALLMEYSDSLCDTSNREYLSVWGRGLKGKGCCFKSIQVCISYSQYIIWPVASPFSTVWIVRGLLIQRNANEQQQILKVIKVTMGDNQEVHILLTTSYLPVCLTAWQMGSHDESCACLIK